MVARGQGAGGRPALTNAMGNPMRWLAALCLVLPFLPASAEAGVTKCPRYSVTVSGTSAPFPGFTYTSTMELKKVGRGAGYGGQWQVVRWVQENTYPHQTDKLSFGPIAIPAIADFGGGRKMVCVGQTHGNKATNTCEGGNLTFEVQGNRMGSAAHPIGKFAGKQLEIHFDPRNPIEPVMTGVVREFPSRSLSLEIRQAGGSGNRVFTTETPGKLELAWTADVKPSRYAKDVRWTVPEIPGSQRDVSPADARGQSVAATYEGLPPKNSAFGKKTVVAEVDAGGGCQARAELGLSIFFPRDATNHPGGKTPNWYYYWSQTRARKGPIAFGGSTGRCARGGDNEKLMGYYRHTIFDSVYYVCDLKQAGASFPLQAIQWTGTQPGLRRVTGIDSFAIASHHENAHYEHYTQWWKAHRTGDRFEDTNRNGIKDAVEQNRDQDADGVPDTLEAGYGMNPTQKSTLGAGLVDEEAICWKAEAAWPVGSADSEDWARPGKQWK